MKYLFLISSVPAPPPPKLMEEIMKLGIERTQDGTLALQGGLMPPAMGGAKVKVSRGKLQVFDGPFTESKEVIGGYAIFECATKEDALKHAVEFMELHRQHWPDWEGECEMRQIMG